uniref:Uncharacterized protein n=1 Tax=Oryza punctata TaxID=4537 RepID=A0A0E0LAG9_ORYPU
MRTKVATTELSASAEDVISEFTSNADVFPPPSLLCDDELRFLPFPHRWPSPPPSTSALKERGREVVTNASSATSGDGEGEASCVAKMMPVPVKKAMAPSPSDAARGGEVGNGGGAGPTAGVVDSNDARRGGWRWREAERMAVS